MLVDYFMPYHDDTTCKLCLATKSLFKISQTRSGSGDRQAFPSIPRKRSGAPAPLHRAPFRPPLSSNIFVGDKKNHNKWIGH